MATKQAGSWRNSWRPYGNMLVMCCCRLPEEVRGPGGRGGQAAAAEGGAALVDSPVVIGGALPSRRRGLGERDPHGAAGYAAHAAPVRGKALDVALQGLARRLAVTAGRLRQSLAWRGMGSRGSKLGYPAARRRLGEEEEPEVDESSAAESNEAVPDELVDNGRGARAAAAAAVGRAAPGSVVDRQRLFSVCTFLLSVRCRGVCRRVGGLSHVCCSTWRPGT